VPGFLEAEGERDRATLFGAGLRDDLEIHDHHVRRFRPVPYPTAKSPGRGIRPPRRDATIARSDVSLEVCMLQWKPKLIALIAVLVLVAAALGQFRWDQFTWF
jgi:hypothetical protein